MKIQQSLRNWIIVIYITIIFMLSFSILNISVRLNKIKLLGIRSDYILHVLMFIPWLILIRWRWGSEGKRVHSFWLGLGVGLMLITLSEALQVITPFRSPSFKDGIANFFGLAAGGILAYVRISEKPSTLNLIDKA